jgi:hypothetical protein
MDASRFASWSPRASRLITTIVLVVVNLVPVPLVVSGAWRSGDVMIAYWLENIVVGFWTLVQIRTARGTQPTATGGKRGVRVTLNGRDAGAMPTGGLAVFFCLHYGIFTVVHGVFAGVIAVMAGGLTGSVWTWVLMLVAMFVSHGLSTAVHWFGQGERDRVTPSAAMMRPYGRIVVLQVAVIGGFLLMAFAGDGWGGSGSFDVPAGLDPVVLPGLLLIVLKLTLDVITHLIQHRRPSGTVVRS